MKNLIECLTVPKEYSSGIVIDNNNVEDISFAEPTTTLSSAIYCPGSLDDTIDWTYSIENDGNTCLYVGCCVILEDGKQCSYLLFDIYKNRMIVFDKLRATNFKYELQEDKNTISFHLLPKTNEIIIHINNSENHYTIPKEYSLDRVFPFVSGYRGTIHLLEYTTGEQAQLINTISGYKPAIPVIQKLSLIPNFNYRFQSVPNGTRLIENTHVSASKTHCILRDGAKGNLYLDTLYKGGIVRVTLRMIPLSDGKIKDLYFGFINAKKEFCVTYSFTNNYLYTNNEKHSVIVDYAKNTPTDVTFEVVSGEYIYMYVNNVYKNKLVYKSNEFLSPLIIYNNIGVNLSIDIVSILTGNTLIKKIWDASKMKYYDLPLDFYTNKENKECVYINNYTEKPSLYAKTKKSILSVLPYGFDICKENSSHCCEIEFKLGNPAGIQGSVGICSNIYELNTFHGFSSKGELVHGQVTLNSKNRGYSDMDTVKIVIKCEYISVSTNQYENSSEIALYVNGNKQTSVLRGYEGILFPAVYLENRQSAQLVSFKSTCLSAMYPITKFDPSQIVTETVTFVKTLYNKYEIADDNSIYSTVSHATCAFTEHSYNRGRITFSSQISEEGEAIGFCIRPIKIFDPTTSPELFMYIPTSGDIYGFGNHLRVIQRSFRGDIVKFYVDFELKLFSIFINEIQCLPLLPLPGASSLPLYPCVYLPNSNTHILPGSISYLTNDSHGYNLFYNYKLREITNHLLTMYDSLTSRWKNNINDWRTVFKTKKLDDYKYKQQNGFGANAKVYKFSLDDESLPEHLEGKHHAFALKRPFTYAYLSPTSRADFITDFNVAYNSPHRYLPASYVFLEDYIYDLSPMEANTNLSTICYSVVEYMFQTAEDFLKQFQIQPENVLPLLLQVATACCHLYSLGMVHRDLKLTNIMFPHPGFSDDLRVIDLGGVTDCLIYNIREGSGNALHRAPELECDESRLSIGDTNSPILVDHSKSDIWGLGILAYELLLDNSIPIESFDFKTEVPMLFNPTPLYNKIYEFIKTVLVVDPTCRPDPYQAIKLLQRLIFDIPETGIPRLISIITLATEMDHEFNLWNRYIDPIYIKSGQEELKLEMICKSLRAKDYTY
ncbi:hypothetical protein WA158_008272 [Blastocystis sp. Blastoise]